MIEREFSHNGTRFWVVVEPAININNEETVYLAYTNNNRPGALLYGELFRDDQGRVQTFDAPEIAFINAVALKQIRIDQGG